MAINANKLILLTDIENLYSKDPRKNKDAHPIKEVHNKQLKEIKDKNINNPNNECETGVFQQNYSQLKLQQKEVLKYNLDGRNEKLNKYF